MSDRTRRGTGQRAGTRTLDAAEGVLAALCECTLDDAFFDLIAAAKRHNVAPLTLAAAIVGLTEDPSGYDCNNQAALAATTEWEPLARRRARATENSPRAALAFRPALLES